MMTVECWVEGTTPMLIHRATEEALSGKVRTNTVDSPENPRDTCEKHVYRLPDRQLAVPGAAFARMLREAGGNHKAKGSRKSLKFILPAAVLVLDDLCPLYLNDRKTPAIDFEVDSRPVTIPATKGRVMRYRARLNEWACVVQLRINETIMSESIVRQLFAEGSQQIGIGDFRPERGGPFGTSSIVRWDSLSERKQTESARRNGAAASA
jgi:hypothetical protein